MAASRKQNKTVTQNSGLYQAILLLETEEECRSFLHDICSKTELRAMEQRFEIARMLNQGYIYNEILERTESSSATISRVARSMDASTGGYRCVFERLGGALGENREGEANGGV